MSPACRDVPRGVPSPEEPFLVVRPGRRDGLAQPEFGEAPLAAHRGPGFQLPGDVIAMLLNRRALTSMTGRGRRRPSQMCSSTSPTRRQFVDRSVCSSCRARRRLRQPAPPGLSATRSGRTPGSCWACGGPAAPWTWQLYTPELTRAILTEVLRAAVTGYQGLVEENFTGFGWALGLNSVLPVRVESTVIMPSDDAAGQHSCLQ